MKLFSFVKNKYVEVDDVRYVMGRDEIGECIVDREGLIGGKWVSLGV